MTPPKKAYLILKDGADPKYAYVQKADADGYMEHNHHPEGTRIVEINVIDAATWNLLG